MSKMMDEYVKMLHENVELKKYKKLYEDEKDQNESGACYRRYLETCIENLKDKIITRNDEIITLKAKLEHYIDEDTEELYFKEIKKQ
jgi:hypothetical protein